MSNGETRLNVAETTERAKAAARSGDRDGALAILESIAEDPGFSAKHLLLKSRLIQTSDGPQYSLADALVALEKALALDPDDAEVLTDLGFFHSRVQADDAKGREYFEAAVEIYRSQYLEALCGLFEITGNSSEAKHLIDQEMERVRAKIVSGLDRQA